MTFNMTTFVVEKTADGILECHDDCVPIYGCSDGHYTCDSAETWAR